MPSKKQIIRDKEYYGDYEQKSRYTVGQWAKILANETMAASTELSILKEIYSSANHAATLSQLSFHHKKDPDWFLDKMNGLAQRLGSPNGFSPDVDLEGREYWWYLLFWGKNTKNDGLEWKLIPELSEALEELFPELEEDYDSYMDEIDKSSQIRYGKEDSVWIAAALLLYEKYYTERPTDIYDLLLMQYEVSQRAQKIHGQDVDVDIITESCNADSGRCQYPYLRDIDKYWRVTYPGEIEDAVLRPEKIDYNAYVPSRFGYLKLSELSQFIETDYCKIADPNYIEVDPSNPFYKISSFLGEYGQKRYMDLPSPTEEEIEDSLKIKAQGQDALSAFHSIGQLLTDQYPGFVETAKAGWLEKDNITIRSCWVDSFASAKYQNAGPALSILCGRMEDPGQGILFSVLLTFPMESPKLADQVMDKCNRLTVLASVDFHVDKTLKMAPMYRLVFGNAIAAYASFEGQALLDGTLEEAMAKFETSIQILASYYLDICETCYCQEEPEDETAALSPSAQPPEASPSSQTSPEISRQGQAGGSAGLGGSTPGSPAVKKRRTDIPSHPDRRGASPSIYPRNLIFVGPPQCGKMAEAMKTAVAIIENLEPDSLKKESPEELLERYGKYIKEGRILYTGTSQRSYGQWMEGALGEGVFASFSNRAAKGNYVCILEEISSDFLLSAMGDAYYLLDEKRREGQPECQTVALGESLEPFSIPSNLYLIGTRTIPEDSGSAGWPSLPPMCSIRFMAPREDSLSGLVIQGIPIMDLAAAMNRRLSYLLGPDCQIGPGYFTPLRDDRTLKALGDVLYEKILPQILRWMEQAPGNPCFSTPYEGARLIFGDYKKSSPDHEMIRAIPLCGKEIFGGSLEMEDKTVYQIQRKAFYLATSYLELM